MTGAFKEAEVAKWKADVWKIDICTSDSWKVKSVTVQMGVNCIQGIAWGVGILETLSMHTGFLTAVSRSEGVQIEQICRLPLLDYEYTNK